MAMGESVPETLLVWEREGNGEEDWVKGRVVATAEMVKVVVPVRLEVVAGERVLDSVGDTVVDVEGVLESVKARVVAMGVGVKVTVEEGESEEEGQGEGVMVAVRVKG